MITEFIDFITAIAPLTIAVILLAKFCLCLFLAFEYQYTRNKGSETRNSAHHSKSSGKSIIFTKIGCSQVSADAAWFTI